MTAFTLARAIFELIIRGAFCDVDNVYFRDANGNSYPVMGYTVDEDRDLILMEEEE